MDSHSTATAGMYNRLRYQGLGFTPNRLHSHSHPTATAGKQNAVPRDSVSPHCYSWYSRLQYSGTQCCPTITAGAVGCSTKSMSLILLFHWVQWAAAPRDSVPSNCYSWYSRLQYEGTLCHHTVVQLVQEAGIPWGLSLATVTVGTAGCSTRGLYELGYYWISHFCWKNVN